MDVNEVAVAKVAQNATAVENPGEKSQEVTVRVTASVVVDPMVEDDDNGDNETDK